jgi:hypothetical protein
MLYTPKYCAECSNAIESYQQGTLIKTQFCENCEGDFKWQKFFPLIGIGIGLLGVIFMLGAYLKKPDKPVNLLTTPTAETASNKNRTSSNQTNPQVSPNTNVQIPQQETAGNYPGQNNSVRLADNAERKTSTAKQNAGEGKQKTTEEAVYLCGAQTKKGTTCSRRVKGGGRCWQHRGQPAMLSADKLVASQ